MGGREGGKLLTYTHPDSVPLLLSSTRGYSLGATQRGATHDGCRRATGQPGAEKRGGGGGGEEEARTGTPCAPNPGSAVSRVSQRSTGSRAGIVGQRNAVPPPPPLSAVCWAAATLSSQSPRGHRNPLFRSVRDEQSNSGPTPRKGHRPRVSLGVGVGAVGSGGGALLQCAAILILPCPHTVSCRINVSSWTCTGG